MLQRSVIAGLTETESVDFGERAGEEMVTLAANRGLDIEGHNRHRCALNHASIADLVTTSIRKPGSAAWNNAGIISLINDNWSSSAYVDDAGTSLRRYLPVSAWNPEREQHELRSWFCAGEVAMLKMPMKLVVSVVGSMNGGRRHSYWSKALLHPNHSSLRFKRRTRDKIEGFKESWTPVYKEDHDEISREKWLSAMLEDGVLQELLFVVHIPVPGELETQRIRDMAQRELEQIAIRRDLPGKQLSTCYSPLGNCPFVECCWSEPELVPSVQQGFDAAS